jgi:hypothetical protein
VQQRIRWVLLALAAGVGFFLFIASRLKKLRYHPCGTLQHYHVLIFPRRFLQQFCAGACLLGQDPDSGTHGESESVFESGDGTATDAKDSHPGRIDI